MIERVWGKADAFEIEFVRVGEKWEFRGLPPDLLDGQYAVELHAAKDSGVVGTWTGILYLLQGVITLQICKPGARATISPTPSVLSVSAGDAKIEISRPTVIGRCKCD